MKKIYETKKKKIEIIGAPQSNQSWFECFDNILFGIAKVSGIPSAIDQGVHVMSFKIEVMNVNGEEDV